MGAPFFVSALLLTGYAQGQECANSAAKLVAGQMVARTGESHVDGMSAALREWSRSSMPSISEEARKRIWARFAEVGKVQWNAPEHRSKVMAIYCAELLKRGYDD